jgi:DNA ligase-1
MLQEVLSAIDNPYIKCHAHRECTGFHDLFDELERVNKAEGEGLMLRDPNSLYENRQSTSLLKVKTFYDDEAVVLGYVPGTGRCTGMVGSLRVKNTHGI